MPILPRCANTRLSLVTNGAFAAALSAANIVNPTFTADVAGTFVAQLIVSVWALDAHFHLGRTKTEIARPCGFLEQATLILV